VLTNVIFTFIIFNFTNSKGMGTMKPKQKYGVFSSIVVTILGLGILQPACIQGFRMLCKQRDPHGQLWPCKYIVDCLIRRV
jgi:hypothetical protein